MKTSHTINIGRTSAGTAMQIPVDVQTTTTAVLGIRGSGKSHTASVVVEDLLELGRQVAIIDPTDVWWGLKSSADGKRPGYPVVVIGGPHGDVPLSDGDGAALADFVVDNPVSVILSLRHLRKAGQRRVVTDFAEQLYHRKGEAQHRTPLMVAIDECDAFIPQRVGGADARMVGAIEDLVRRGRSAGLGVMLISQRAASINKDVLTQIELLVAHRHTSPQDRKALDAWVEAHDTGGHRDEFMRSVANLEQGTTWFWSPGWLDVFAKVAVRGRRTFDSSATPKVGETAVPAARAEIDLDALKAQLEQTVEQARANDPKTLKSRIAALENQLAAQAPVVDQQAIERAVHQARRGMRESLRPILESFEKTAESIADNIEALRVLMGATAAPRVMHPTTIRLAEPLANNQLAQLHKAAASSVSEPVQIIKDNDNPDWFRPAHQRILDALAWLVSFGMAQPHRSIVAAVAGVSPKSGGFRNDVSRLSANGYITYPSTGLIALTLEGTGAARLPQAARNINELHDAWRRCPALRPAHIRLMDVLIECYPDSLSRDNLAAAVGVSPSSGGFRNDVSRLSSMGLATYPSTGQVQAGPLLFPERMEAR